jgi:adenine deaminase
MEQQLTDRITHYTTKMDPIQSVALGTETADTVIRNGDVLLVEQGEIVERDIAIRDGHIATLTDDASSVTDNETIVLDATGTVAIPGLIDAHTHVDLHQPIERSYHRSLEGGTTTVVGEIAEIGPLLGLPGIEEMLQATANIPFDVRLSIPPQPFIDTFEPLKLDSDEREMLLDLLATDRVVAAGETAWIHVVGTDSPVSVLYDRAAAEGVPVSGHAAGCRGDDLAAFATIIDNDHEAITGEGVRQRISHGIHTIGRYGSIRDDIDAIATVWDDFPSGELSLATDGMWPRDLLRDGHMNAVVRRAVEAGVDPIPALRMATLHPARHFGLDGRGTLRSGTVANVVLLDDLQNVTVDTVLVSGNVVVREGVATVDPSPHEYDSDIIAAVDRGLTANSIASIPLRSSATAVNGNRVRAIEHEGRLLTSETVVSPPINDGAFSPAPDEGLLTTALVDRHPNSSGNSFTGFLTGLGSVSGAVATTVTWEQPGVLAVGGSVTDMRAALARVARIGGGWAIVEDSDIIADLALTIGGLCANADIEETAARYDDIDTTLREIGFVADRPTLPLQTLTTPGIPALRLSSSGYADLRQRRIVGLDPTEPAVDGDSGEDVSTDAGTSKKR